MPLVEIPGKGNVSFPDTMTPEQIQDTIRYDIMGEKRPVPVLDRVKSAAKTAAQGAADLLLGPMEDFDQGGVSSFPLQKSKATTPAAPKKDEYPTGFFERRVIPDAPKEPRDLPGAEITMPIEDRPKPQREYELKEQPSLFVENARKTADLYAKAGHEVMANNQYMLAGLGRLIDEVVPGSFGKFIQQTYQQFGEEDEDIAAKLKHDPVNASDEISQRIISGALGLLDPQLALMPTPTGYGAARALSEYGRGADLPETIKSGMQSALIAKGFGLVHGMKPVEAAAKMGAIGAVEAGTDTTAAGGSPKDAAGAALEGAVTQGAFAGAGAGSMHPAARKMYKSLVPAMGHDKAMEMSKHMGAALQHIEAIADTGTKSLEEATRPPLPPSDEATGGVPGKEPQGKPPTGGGAAKDSPYPEAPETVNSQISLMLKGKKPAVLITPGEEIPAIPKGVESLETERGTFLFRPDVIRKENIQEAVDNDTIGTVLGYGIDRKPEKPIGVVTVRDKDGIEKQAVVTDQENLNNVLEAAQAVTEQGDKIGFESPDSVLKDRIKKPAVSPKAEQGDTTIPGEAKESQGGGKEKPAMTSEQKKPIRVQRIEEPGAEVSFEKPQGLYTTPADIESPHSDLGGKKTVYEISPEAKILDIPEYDSDIAMRKGAVSAGAGVHAARHFLGDGQFQTLREKPKSELTTWASERYPDTDFSRYHDAQEVMEAIGGLEARKAGYDVFRVEDKKQPEFSETVILNKNVVKEIKEKPEPFKEQAAAFAPEAGFRRQPETASHPTDTPQKRSEIVNLLKDKLDVPIRTGRFRVKDALGIFKVKSEVIRSGKANDIEAISHEVGHALQKFLWPEARTRGGSLASQPFKQFSGELVPLATKPRAGQPMEPEGFAEFVRLYITDPESARSRAPGFFEYFEKELDGRSPESKEVLLEARRMYERWLKQPALARILGHISVGDKDKPKKTFDDFYTATIDDLNPLKNVVDAMTKSEKIPAGQNPYVLARLFRGWNGKAEHFLERSPFKFDTYENVGKPLKEILKPIESRLDEFRAYLVAKRALELKDRKIETGVLEADAREVISNLEKDFESTRQDLLEFQEHTLQYLEDSGMISGKTHQAMRAANGEYVPFYRVMESGKKGGVGSGKGLEARQTTKRIKGSWRDIVDPLESIIKNTYVYIEAAEKNAIGRSLVDLAEKKEGLGKFVEKIPSPVQGVKIGKDEIEGFLKKVMEKSDMDIEELDAFLEEKFQIFRPTAFVPKHNVISAWREGKRELYEVHPDIARVFQALDKESVNTLVRILSFPARLLRAGATLTPEFIGRNPARDQFAAFVYSKYGYVPGVDLMRGIFHSVKQDETYWNWQKAGGAHSMLVSMDREYLQKGLKQVLKSHPRIEGAVKNPIEALRILSEFTESGTRLGEFQKGVKKEGSTKEGMQAAAFASREVTLDFARIGAKTKAVNMITAFWNANLQGHDKMIRAFKEKPVITSMKAAAAITVPSLLLAWANHDDPRYKEVPRWQKDLFWIVMTGDMTNDQWSQMSIEEKAKFNEDHTIWRIPKPFELGILFGSVPERVMEYVLDNDPAAFEEIGDTLTGMAPSLVPTAMIPLMENWANRSYFFGGPLVPEGKKDLLSRYQYSTRTTETAKLLGGIIDKISITKDPSIASPAKIENLIRGWSGGLGKYALEMSDVALRSAGAVKSAPKPEKTRADIPFVKGFVVRYPSSTSASISKFYDEYQAADKVIKTVTYLAKKEGKGLEAKELLLANNVIKANDAYGALRMLSAFAENIQNNPEMSPAEKRKLLDRVFLNMQKIAAEGNKTLKIVKAMKKYAPAGEK